VEYRNQTAANCVAIRDKYWVKHTQLEIDEAREVLAELEAYVPSDDLQYNRIVKEQIPHKRYQIRELEESIIDFMGG